MDDPLYSKANSDKSKAVVQKEVDTLWAQLKKTNDDEFRAQLVELQDKTDLQVSRKLQLWAKLPKEGAGKLTHA